MFQVSVLPLTQCTLHPQNVLEEKEAKNITGSTNTGEAGASGNSVKVPSCALTEKFTISETSEAKQAVLLSNLLQNYLLLLPFNFFF